MSTETKKMPTKKRVENHSTSESCTGSTSDTSTSTSSSSGSHSSSSTDSDSSSSQDVNKSQTSSDKKSAALHSTALAAKSNFNRSSRKSTDTNTKAPSKQTTKPKPTPNKIQKQPPPVYSSEDEDCQKTTSASQNIPKRKSNAKPKTSATVTPKNTANPVIKKSTPKSHSKPTPNFTSKNTNKTAVLRETATKMANLKTSKAAPSSKADLNKKKSIFSPENSSESDEESCVTKMKQSTKSSNQKPRPKACPRPVDKSKPTEKVKINAKAMAVKSKVIESSTTATTTTDTSSSSDSDESAHSSASVRQTPKASAKKSSAAIKPLRKSHSDSDAEADTSKQVTRKLTRSASTRKSKHVMGKNVYSDTDSDTESTKRSLSRSPVKKATVTTKGKTKNTKKEAKSRVNEMPAIQERKCVVEGCNNNGHLGGHREKHFTVEACPIYHNITPATCKEEASERKKREEIRKKAISARGGQDHKQYLQRIKDARSKFKEDNSSTEVRHADKTREPFLKNIVPDYDLQMFCDAQAMSSELIEEELKMLPNTKGTKYIEMGKFEMEVWYQSPYPEDYARMPKLYICEYCLRYMKSRTVLTRHVVKCVWRHPPGDEVYRKDKISVWEVDGKRYKQYCQNLCLLAKFFLDHKTLYYDVEPFLFYVMTISDTEGCHTVGYFSKEKNSFLNYNVSCILTLPPYQRQGYGRLLIDFSYLLTRVEGKVGSPEKPLSDLGLISYRSYWKDVLLNYLCSNEGTTLSIKDISQEMAIHSYDLVSTLEALGMMKYWKGKHIILKKQDVLDEYLERVKRRGSLFKEVDPACLRWEPFVPPQPIPV